MEGSPTSVKRKAWAAERWSHWPKTHAERRGLRAPVRFGATMDGSGLDIGSDWGFPDSYASTLFVDQRGTLWIAGEHEIFYLERDSQRFQLSGVRVEGVDSGEFIESPDGRTWYADDSGIHGLPVQSAGSPRAAVSNARTSYTKLIDRVGSVWMVGPIEGNAVCRLISRAASCFSRTTRILTPSLRRMG